ncbi:ECF transporter S component [Bifidobacterium vespertilionis]|uniref:ABC transporter permease n=1 Tax=Bifidobacterium vespertilionis TaxID=2562524 RepID=A0A5J5E0X5_9BIFI|nr:ECF transporter S component [Bifidobacterium vespertilionis]KAA8822469.1 ABC transporter permease [Bifidobacterium vespertilionis]KAA8824469.1 ABC transporter permease [Bifidobacterium vespertilionis]MBT1178688.1 ECF transporter S component [Bifidobacterium vespertilionis]
MSTATTNAQPNLKWRVVDIAVASVIGVASAFIYWLVAILTYGPWEAMDLLVPGLPGLFNGLWLFAGPLAAIIVRKPGAAIYAEVIAGVLEALMGNMWGGAATFLIALVQGVLAEVAFLAFAYRKWNLPVTILSGALAGVGCWGYSFFTNLQAIDLGGSYGVMYLATTVISGIVFAGVLMWYLYVAIAKTGALDKFASGREVRNA